MFACYFYAHKVCIHSLPAIAAVINTILTRGVLIPGHALYMILMGLVYMPLNYVGTQYKGEPLYHFMDWKDHKTLVNGGIVFIIGATLQ